DPADRAVDTQLPAEVEPRQPAGALVVAAGDPVELVLQRGGEVVVYQALEVAFHQSDDRERDPGRHERGALLPHVAAVLDGLDDRRVRRGAPDAQLLELADQRGLAVAGGRRRRVAVRVELGGRQALALGQLRKALLLVVGLAALLGVDGLDVRLEETGEGDRAARRGEHALLTTGGRAGDLHRHRGALRVRHLRRDGPLPDQLVEPELVGLQLARDLTRGAEHLTGGPDRLVRLLGVLDLAVVLPRPLRHVLGAVQVGRLAARGRQR